MAVRATEISDLLKQQIQGFSDKAVVSNVGQVIGVGDGVATVHGLSDAMQSELVEFTKDGTLGLVLNLGEDNVSVIVMGDYTQIEEGDEVRTTGNVASVPVGDALLGRVVNALGQPIYLAPPLIATLLIYLIGKHISRARIWIVTFDAIGLAIFSVTGTTIALGAGANYPAALLMGALTACGGSLMRDAVASEDPAIFRGTDLYLIPALFGAGVTLIADATNFLGGVVSLIIAALAFVFRMLAWRLQWRVPQPMRQWSYRETPKRMKRLPSVFRKPD